MRLALVGSHLLLASSTALGKPCKCLYGDACWPSTSQFTSLAGKLSQPLIHPAPPEAACYDASQADKCAEVQANYDRGRWRSDQSGSTQSPNFEVYIFSNNTIEACYRNATLGIPCGQGSVPPLGVDARTPKDIQETVKFAAKHNLRLVIKNTGHDFLGRSTARGALLLWTHHLKNVSYDSAFVPTGAPRSTRYESLTVEAGVQWHEAYDAALQQNKLIVGGISDGGSVGAAGGWIQGGGHSVFSPYHGLGVDNVLQFSVVTANGDLVVANAHRNTDLFWALRGGGGGTYGVVTSATYRLHPLPPLVVSFLATSFNNLAVARDVVTELVKIAPSLAANRWGCYNTGSNTTLSVFCSAPNSTLEHATSLISPFFQYVQNATGGAAQSSVEPAVFDRSWYEPTTGLGQNGHRIEIGSRFVTAETIEKDPGKLADELLALVGTFQWNQVAGGSVSTVDPDATGLNPAWRKAIANVVWGVDFPEGISATEINIRREFLKAEIDRFEALDPSAGTYFNEASLYEKNPQHTFFGSHYPRLGQIKKRYDPTDLFLVYEGVGSERWDKELHCRVA